MNNIFKKYWLIFAILVLAAFLRFWQLGSYPALNADEASIGYDAYSLIKTGMDQHGNPWPVHFQSFNDYKPGLYMYIVLPFVKILGLNEWAVRIPGALAGVLTVFFVHLLARKLFPDLETKIGKLSFGIGEIAAFTLAISPWHIHFSRGGWEVNSAALLIVLGVYFFIKYAEKLKLSNLILSAIFFVLSLYTYHAARVVSPLLVIGLSVIYRGNIFKNIKYLLIAGGIGLVLLIPLGRDLVKGDVFSRAAGVGLFADKGPVNRIDEQRGEHGNPNNLFAKVIHNKAVNYGLAFAENWVAHYHGLFLFISGDVVQRDQVPETGEMYMTDIVFVCLGLIWIFRNFKKYSQSLQLIVLWLIVAPIAAALTFQAPSALRSENMVIPLSIISAVGLYALLCWFSSIRNKNIGIILGTLTFVFIIWQFARYEHMYWVHMSKEYPFSSQYGVKELVEYVSQNQNKYKNIVVTDRYDQPYILFLFYMKYPPEKFQFNHSLSVPDQYGFSTVREFDRYQFVTFTDWKSMQEDYPGSLIIGTPTEVSQNANIIKRIYGTNGYEYFDIVAN